MLIDKAMTLGPEDVRLFLRENAGEITSVDVTPIAEWHFRSVKSEYTRNDFPFMVPSLPTAFFEFREPDRAFTDDGTVIENPNPALSGALVYNCDTAVRMRLIRGQCREIPPRTMHVSAYQPFMFLHGVFHRLPVAMINFLDESGLLIDTTLTVNPAVTWRPDFSRFDSIDGELANIAQILNLACSFMNCKNVQLEDSTQELAPPEKIRRRLKLPDIRRHTLIIDGHSGKRRMSSGGNGDNDPIMPLHLCRGSFAVYGEANKLFGRLTGRFWRPPHVKGKRENGQVVKSYSVKPQEPKQESA